uniref:Uncharacterized protein n=1 Tax=Tanacetum cinerariifolium TaxID=118510 RepID=A0A6L2NID4_TANCI|nr:hypothetical protein [Tanacetum cinerariifolium]
MDRKPEPRKTKTLKRLALKSFESQKPGRVTFAPLSDSGSFVPLLLHNADELYDSSTSCWNPAIRNESNACIELFASCRSLCKG